jgi:hypothetical protein
MPNAGCREFTAKINCFGDVYPNVLLCVLLNLSGELLFRSMWPQISNGILNRMKELCNPLCSVTLKIAVLMYLIQLIVYSL